MIFTTIILYSKLNVINKVNIWSIMKPTDSTQCLVSLLPQMANPTQVLILLQTGLPISGTPQSQPLLPVTTTEVRTAPTSSVPALNTGLDENQTVYDLIPTIINQIPIVTQTIIEGSKPPIRQSSTADATGDYMYQFPDGTVRVHQKTQ